MSGAGVSWMVEALIASAILIALVLLVRGPVRRAFGAPVAYALWSLPLLRLLLPPLPQELRPQVTAPITGPLAAPLTDVGQQVTVFIVPAAPGNAAAPAFLTPGLSLALLWGMGAAAFIVWQVMAYRRFRRRLLSRATILDRVAGVTIVESPAAAGPLAFGIARRFVAFPRDFAARYDPDERDLALAHELGHHARGDLIANWLALAVLALHWFNPLAWYAFRAFRADQEMANDARVLARLGPSVRHAYACAIVKAAHGGAIAAACHLHTVDDLKGRLKMLGMNRISRGRGWTGLITIAATGAGALALTASGTQAAERMRLGVTQATEAALPRATPAMVQPAEDVRVVVEQDGERTVYEGAEAEAWVAASPLPRRPAPPASPLPPAAPAPAAMAAHPAASAPPLPPSPPTPADVHVAVNIPEVRSATCDGDAEKPVVVHDETAGRRRITICTDRIARTQEHARAAALHAADAQRVAMANARHSMHAARRSILENRHLEPADREEALSEIDAGLSEMEATHHPH
jgi:beta-lactamase regulating signal transducer with metallopeptidase domain